MSKTFWSVVSVVAGLGLGANLFLYVLKLVVA